jgi:hypothetical protein
MTTDFVYAAFLAFWRLGGACSSPVGYQEVVHEVPFIFWQSFHHFI